jgi:drug/metabolite transporter (DMT)-like permease
MSQREDDLRGVGLMLGAAASFASFSILVKLIGPEFPIFQIAFFRGIVAFVLLTGFLSVRGKPIPTGVNRKDLIIRSFLGFGGLMTYVYALNHIELGLAAALNQSSPIFVAVFAFLILRERTGFPIAALAVIGFCGAALVVSPDLSSINIHASVGLLSAVLSGLAYVWVRKLRVTDRPVTIVLFFSGTVAILSLPIALYQGWVAPSPAQWAGLLGLGVFSLSGQLCLSWSYRLGTASVVSPYLYFSVLISLIVGWAVWQEWPASTALCGAGLLIASSLGIGWIAGHRRTEETATLEVPL